MPLLSGEGLGRELEASFEGIHVETHNDQGPHLPLARDEHIIEAI